MATGTKTVAAKTHPIERLRERATALEVAITSAMASPRKLAVHQLRTTVRRLEAQVALLGQLAALPEESAETQTLQKQLDKMRRAAGKVRDLDVLRDLLKSDPSLPKAAAKELRYELKQDREERVKKLQRTLLKRLPKVAGAVEGMVQSIGTANGLVLPDLRLLATVERWTQTKADAKTANAMDDDELHTARKVAKAARYMAESGSGSAKARAVAARYEEQQEAGGQWHDWAELEAVAREHFGKKHPLTLAAAEHCRVARVKYVGLLKKEVE